MTKQASFKTVLHKLDMTEIGNKLNFHGFYVSLKIFIPKRRFISKKKYCNLEISVKEQL
jgi:hypothetical protein